MANAHALLSASASERWLNCTAAPRYEEQFPETTSEYAEEGRLAHSICELKLLKKFTSSINQRTYTNRLNKLKKEPLYSEEMERTGDFYIEHLTERAMSYDSPPLVNAEVRVDLTAYIPEGFGTCDCVMIGGDTLDITDYKHGKGVPVSAVGNSQMRLYALGALTKYEPFYGGMIKQVRITIVQPRVADEPTTETLTVEELKAWGETVKPLAQKAYSGFGDFVPGDHCRQRQYALYNDLRLTRAVKTRDGDTCQYCGKTVNWNDRRGTDGGTYDHVDPEGDTAVENIVVCCRSCSTKKDGRTPKQANMPLIISMSTADTRQIQADTPQEIPTITQPNITPPDQQNQTNLQPKRFDEFWAAYPKKVGKKEAQKAWGKVKPNTELFAKILKAVKYAIQSEQWQRENGRFIPNPTTWLNQGRWDDEIPQSNGGVNNARNDGNQGHNQSAFDPAGMQGFRSALDEPWGDGDEQPSPNE